jgi:nucleotide-binding universal stress UspA family protein
MDKTTIIWATDGSKWSDGALEVLRDVAKRWTNPQIVAVHIDQRLVGRAGDVSFLADEQDLVAKIRSQVYELEQHGFTAELELRHTHKADQASIIASIAKDREADVIFVGTRGHGRLAGALLGSVAQGLLHTAPCPVLVVPPAVAGQLVGASDETAAKATVVT